MTKPPIRLKEINRLARQARDINKHLNDQQQTGSYPYSASKLDPKTAKVKDLFTMFGVKPKG